MGNVNREREVPRKNRKEMPGTTNTAAENKEAVKGLIRDCTRVRQESSCWRTWHQEPLKLLRKKEGRKKASEYPRPVRWLPGKTRCDMYKWESQKWKKKGSGVPFKATMTKHFLKLMSDTSLQTQESARTPRRVNAKEWPPPPGT